MGTKNNPGDFDCYANANPDEPMFVLLARDENAPWVVEQWCAAYFEKIGDAATPEQIDKLHEAEACAESMRRWRAEANGDPK